MTAWQLTLAAEWENRTSQSKPQAVLCKGRSDTRSKTSTATLIGAGSPLAGQCTSHRSRKDWHSCLGLHRTTASLLWYFGALDIYWTGPFLLLARPSTTPDRFASIGREHTRTETARGSVEARGGTRRLISPASCNIEPEEGSGKELSLSYRPLHGMALAKTAMARPLIVWPQQSPTNRSIERGPSKELIGCKP